MNPAGKIVVVGTLNSNDTYMQFPIDLALARYNADGSLDVTFGGDGMIITDFGGNERGLAADLQPEGKILVACECDWAIFLVRYNADGSLDTGFGEDGMASIGFGGESHCKDIALQPDGKILLAGSNNYTGVLLRYNPDGSLNSAFNRDGILEAEFSGFFMGVVVQPDGKIVAAGGAYDQYDFVLARYNPDGSPDTSFNDGERVTIDFGGSDHSNALALQADGKIALVGETWVESYAYLAVARYDPDASGGFTYNPNGQFEYLAAGEVATDTFTYVVSDGWLTDTATVSITIIGVDEAPLAEGAEQGVDLTADLGEFCAASCMLDRQDLTQSNCVSCQG